MFHTSMFLSLTPSLSLCLKINKIFFKKRKGKGKNRTGAKSLSFQAIPLNSFNPQALLVKERLQTCLAVTIRTLHSPQLLPHPRKVLGFLVGLANGHGDFCYAINTHLHRALKPSPVIKDRRQESAGPQSLLSVAPCGPYLSQSLMNGVSH